MSKSLVIVTIALIFGVLFVITIMIITDFQIWKFVIDGPTTIMSKYPNQILNEPRPPIIFKKDVIISLLEDFIVHAVCFIFIYVVYVVYSLYGREAIIIEIVSLVIFFLGFFASVGLNIFLYKKYNRKWIIYSFKKAEEQFRFILNIKDIDSITYTPITQTEMGKHDKSIAEIEKDTIQRIKKIKFSGKNDDWQLGRLARAYAICLINFTDTDSLKCYIQKDGQILALTEEQLGEIIESNFFYLLSNCNSWDY